MFHELDLTVNSFSQQREWRHLILFAFFLGGLGAGLFTISMMLNLVPGLILGWLLVAVGKSGCHIAYLGRPERFWRMIWRPQTSWISRGLIGVLLFIVLGLVYLAQATGAIAMSQGLVVTLQVLTGITALWVMIYTGFVMSLSPGIPAWNTTIVPLMFVIYGILGGLDLVLIILGLQGGSAAGLNLTLRQIELWELGLLLVTLVFTLVYVLVLNGGSVTTREAVRRMLFGELFVPFVIGVIIAGTVVPAALVAASLFLGVSSPVLLVTAGVLALIGSLSFRWSLLQVGLYSPLL